MRNFFKKLGFALLALLILLPYQNCDFVDGLGSVDNGNILESSGGNGDGYGGKLVSYHRHAFGRSCGENSFYKNLYLTENKEYILEEPDGKSCVQKKIKEGLQFTKNKRSVVMYDSALYQIDKETEVKRLEIFCKNTLDNDEEVYVYYEPSSSKYSLETYVKDASKKTQNINLSVNRTKNSGLLRFQNYSKGSSFQMFFANDDDNPKWHTADYEYLIDEQKKKVKYQCLLTNSLDPESLKPALSQKILMLPKDEEVSVSLVENQAELSSDIKVNLSPQAPVGLELNSQMISLQGTPRQAQKILAYEISFETNGMSLNDLIYIGVGQEVRMSQELANCRINEMDNLYICNLSQIIESKKLENQSLWLNLDVKEIYLESMTDMASDIDLYMYSSNSSPAKVLSLNDGRSIFDFFDSRIYLRNLSFSGYLPVGESGALMNLKASNLFVEDSIFEPGNYKDYLELYEGGSLNLSYSNAWIKNSSFIDNYNLNEAHVGRDGGAIFASSGNLEISQSSFIGNRALRGGAINVWGVNLLIRDSDFIGNHSSSQGGAIAARSSKLKIYRSNFSENSVIFDGGAINASFSNELYILNSNFYNNTAHYGAAIKVGSGGFFPYVMIQNSQFLYDGNLKSRSVFHNRSQYFLEQSFTSYHLLGNSFYTNPSASLKQTICRPKRDNEEDYIISLGGNFYNSEDCDFSHASDRLKLDMQVSTHSSIGFEYILDHNYYSNAYCPKYDILGQVRERPDQLCRSGPLK